MMAARVFARISRAGVAGRLIIVSSRQENLSSGFHSLIKCRESLLPKSVPCETSPLFKHLPLTSASFQRFGFSSSASPNPTDKEANQSTVADNAAETSTACPTDKEANETVDSDNATENTESAKNTGGSTHQAKAEVTDMVSDLSVMELVELVKEKEELLKLKHDEVEKMQDKVLRSYAEMQNVLDRSKRESENSRKFAIQNFAKNLLDVADNLGRASSVVKESFAKIDQSKDPVGAVPLLKTLLEGVEMTEKQLAEVFRKYGIEKFDPTNEQFDPHRHNAAFQISDASKPPGTVAVVLKLGYMLHDRVLRPAEVGVTEASNNETE